MLMLMEIVSSFRLNKLVLNILVPESNTNVHKYINIKYFLALRFAVHLNYSGSLDNRFVLKNECVLIKLNGIYILYSTKMIDLQCLYRRSIANCNFQFIVQIVSMTSYLGVILK